MFMSLLASFAGATVGKALNIGSGMINGYMQDYFNRRQESRAYDRNLEMWNMENAYNSPQAQMQRYKDAGLNPNLVYNSLGGSTNIGSVGMANNEVKADSSDYANPYYHYLNMKNRQYEDAVKNQQLAKMENENKLLTEKIATEKFRRKPPKNVAENNGGDNLLDDKKDKSFYTQLPYGFGFGRRANGSYYLTYLGHEVVNKNKILMAKKNHNTFVDNVVFDKKSGKYMNILTGDLYD